MTIGIYKITDKLTGEFYIGKSKHIEYRWEQHVGSLYFGKHYNENLQNIVNSNPLGVNTLTFEIIEVCELEVLSTKEIESIRSLKPTLNIHQYKLNSKENISLNNFAESLKLYIKMYENDLNDPDLILLEEDYPIFKESIEKLGINKIRTIGYSKIRLEKALRESSDKTIVRVQKQLPKYFEKNVWYKAKDVKVKLIKIYKYLKLDQKAKATDLLKYAKVEQRQSHGVQYLIK